MRWRTVDFDFEVERFDETLTLDVRAKGLEALEPKRRSA